MQSARCKQVASCKRPSSDRMELSKTMQNANADGQVYNIIYMYVYEWPKGGGNESTLILFGFFFVVFSSLQKMTFVLALSIHTLALRSLSFSLSLSVCVCLAYLIQNIK